MFPPVEYLEWIRGRPEAATHDLGSSDLHAGASPGVVPDRLADRPDPDASVEELVAAEYGVEPSQVLVTAGASQANVLAAAAALGAAGWTAGGGVPPTVLVESPGYEPLVATPTGLGARVRRFDRPGPEYALDPERVTDAADGRTALVTVSNRHNPSGRLASRERLRAVAEVARDEGGHLLVDEVYAPYVTATGTASRGGDRSARTAFGGPTAAGLPGTVVVSSLTKFLGFGGLRVGWLVGDEALVDRARTAMAHLPSVARPSRRLAARALAARDDLGVDSRELVAANHDLLADFLAARDDLDCRLPPDSTFAFPAHASASGDAVVAAAEDRDLLVIPGRFFGDPGRFRTSLGRSPGECEAALEVLGEVLDGF